MRVETSNATGQPLRGLAPADMARGLISFHFYCDENRFIKRYNYF
jgi:hypothetical protein